MRLRKPKPWPAPVYIDPAAVVRTVNAVNAQLCAERDQNSSLFRHISRSIDAEEKNRQDAERLLRTSPYIPNATAERLLIDLGMVAA